MLDLVLGLSFLFFVLSLVCAAVNEMIAAVFGRRGRTLRRGICVLLDSKAEAAAIYRAPLIKSPTGVNASRRTSPPTGSPRPSSTATPPGLLDDPPEHPDFATVRSARTRDALTSLWRHAGGDVASFQADVAQWFDDTMNRKSGWYRRRTDLILVGLAVVVTVALNVNGIGVAERVWADAGVEDPALTHDRLQQLRTECRRLDASRLPLGWSPDARPDTFRVGLLGWSQRPGHLVGGPLLVRPPRQGRQPAHQRQARGPEVARPGAPTSPTGA